MNLFGLVILVIVFLASAPGGLAAKGSSSAVFTTTGQVGMCTDGDTCRIYLKEATGWSRNLSAVRDSEFSNKETRVRLSGIDAPEKKQAFGPSSRDFLNSLVRGKTVDLECDGRSYDRRTCSLFSGGTNIQMEMVKNGWAWRVPKYDKKRRYEEAMLLAREKKIGLWQAPKNNWQSPFCFRHHREPTCKADPTHQEI